MSSHSAAQAFEDLVAALPLELDLLRQGKECTTTRSLADLPGAFSPCFKTWPPLKHCLFCKVSRALFCPLFLYSFFCSQKNYNVMDYNSHLLRALVCSLWLICISLGSGQPNWDFFLIGRNQWLVNCVMVLEQKLLYKKKKQKGGNILKNFKNSFLMGF